MYGYALQGFLVKTICPIVLRTETRIVRDI